MMSVLANVILLFLVCCNSNLCCAMQQDSG